MPDIVDTERDRIDFYNKNLRHAIDLILGSAESIIGSKYTRKEVELHFDVVLIEEYETENGFYEIDPRHFITVKYVDIIVLEAIFVEETDFLEVKTLVSRDDIWSGTIRDKAGHIIMDNDRKNSEAQGFEEKKKELLQVYEEDLKKDILSALAGAKPYSGHLVSGFITEDDRKCIKVYRCKSVKEKYFKIFVEFYGRTGLIVVLKKNQTEIEHMVNPSLWKKLLQELATEVQEKLRKKFSKDIIEIYT